MKNKILSLILFLSAFTQGFSQSFVFPAIQEYGGVIEVPFEVEKPDPTKKYKLVVELGNKLKSKEEVGEDLDYAARMYNLHVYAGVPAENIELALVIFSGSTPLVLSNKEYQKRFGLPNPNAALLEEFQRNGVQVIVCGQSMMKQNLVPEMIYPGVRLAASRFTATTDLTQKGYQVIVL
ncbi:DsrE family protein [Algoriphagus sp. CAU 1675]|uniref:DsrE family protein n=1 Tax=Algoriphagus sp. CAU 1675 TaxID=3032597 RepID=UPI0023DAB583|nr:DsrE family protein [Algoriphagus sp. CAU 1675]MDF2156750.1 DsrE family protein [Algoriphagus sp. CAU 1675]